MSARYAQIIFFQFPYFPELTYVENSEYAEYDNSQGAADARRRACRRTHVLQMPANAAGAVPCERLPKYLTGY